MDASSDTTVAVVRAEAEDLAACFELRRRVFVTEQGVPAALDRDEQDATSEHWLARRNGCAVGTARARIVRQGAHLSVKAERVAVAPEARRTGAGRALMKAIEDWAAARGCQRVTLNAQLPARAFYDALGYERLGEVFEEAGIAHVAMSKSID